MREENIRRGVKDGRRYKKSAYLRLQMNGASFAKRSYMMEALMSDARR
jgi:hypothetical protein